MNNICPKCRKDNHVPTLGTALKCLNCGTVFQA
jgi:hypothetical protein